jgi:hypothetical protein
MDQVHFVCIVLYWYPTPVTQGLTSATDHGLPKPLTDCIQTQEPPSHHSFMSLTATHSDSYTILPLYRPVTESTSNFTAPASLSCSVSPDKGASVGL